MGFPKLPKTRFSNRETRLLFHSQDIFFLILNVYFESERISVHILVCEYVKISDILLCCSSSDWFDIACVIYEKCKKFTYKILYVDIEEVCCLFRRVYDKYKCFIHRI